MGACTRRKRNPLTFKKLSSALAINQLVPAGRFLRVFSGAGCRSGCSSRRRRGAGFVCAALQGRCLDIHARADESGRHPIFFCDQIVALLADRNN